MNTAELDLVMQIRLIGFCNLAGHREQGAINYHMQIRKGGLQTRLEF